MMMMMMMMMTLFYAMDKYASQCTVQMSTQPLGLVDVND